MSERSPFEPFKMPEPTPFERGALDRYNRSRRRTILPLQPRRTQPPLPQQLISGPWGSPEYQVLRAAMRNRAKVMFEGRGLAYVLTMRRDGDRFKAVIQPVRG